MPTAYEIHPAIGIARVGSSRVGGGEGYFIGPEPDGPPPRTYRDPGGDLKRQAARFRIFRCHRDGDGRLLEAVEIVPGMVRKVTWTVHLANRKGVARRIYRSGPGFRNRATGDDAVDRALIIDGGPVSIGAPGEHRSFAAGRFRAAQVPLGEIFMEPGGRLVVLGGHGVAGSDPPQLRLDPDKGHRADNNDWFDDTSDGPVTAIIELDDGTSVEATAWVIVGPPDYAPGIANQVTLYDVLYDLAVRRGLLTAPAGPGGCPSFTYHVRPILARAMGYRWVNRAANFGRPGESNGHGPGGSADFTGMWARLADPSPRSEGLRRSIADRLRDPESTGPSTEVYPLDLIPRLTASQSRRSDPGNVLALTATQYAMMKAWAAGDFVDDLGRAEPVAEPLTDALDRTALESCVGGALYPGIEANGVILADTARYMEGEPFRLSHDAVRPGEVTQYNAVPWQADYVSCRWQELTGPWPMRLAWWPAQRPDDVFTGVGATEMVAWARGVGEDYQDMIEKWDRLGLVVDRGVPGTPFFVEAERDSRVLGP
jgi:hypothetical protein